MMEIRFDFVLIIYLTICPMGVSSYTYHDSKFFDNFSFSFHGFNYRHLKINAVRLNNRVYVLSKVAFIEDSFIVRFFFVPKFCL